MRILIACEESGRVRDAFIAKGHDAISCDILPTSSPGPHIQGYLEDVVGDGSEWDMIIAFPPCTYICSSGLHHNKRDPARAAKTEYALNFVAMILNLKCPRIVVENPVGCISTRIAYDEGEEQYIVLNEPNKKFGIQPQWIQPYNFGADASKKTGLWSKGVTKLKNCLYVPPRRIMWNGKLVDRWANQTDSGQNKLGPSDDRALLRSKTYPGIAQAMAEQWG